MAVVTGRWDVKHAMVLMLVLACLGSILLLVLLRRTTALSLRRRLWAWALLNVILFCPRDYENFLWGTMLFPLIPGVVLLVALVINSSELSLRWKVLANSALAFVATYSFANGMLLWALAAPIVPEQKLVGKQNLSAIQARWYAFYAFCAIASIAFYFHHYIHPVQHPQFTTSFADTLPLLRFLLSWVGSLFAVAGADPLFFGCFFLGIFAALAIAAIRVGRRQSRYRSFYPWFAIAIYALMSGAITASGRLHFGLGSASAPRYAVIVVFFYVGLAGLAASLSDVWIIARHRIEPRLVFASGLIVGLFTAGWLSSLSTELARVSVIREDRKDLALAVQWIPAIPDNPDLGLALVPPSAVAQEAVALTKYDALRPRLIPQSLAAVVFEGPAEENPSISTLESAWFNGDHRLFLTGKAWLPYRNARADCVVVGYTNSDGRLTPFTVFQPTYKRQRLKGQFDIKRLPPNGFAASIDPANLPTGTLTLRAWAVDMRANRALPMGGAVSVDNEPVQRN
ncbi:MAG TPA: hypothetical protein VJ420_03645 [Candidatus Udaeobacter sp.]|nr:hypothetical protein [Candidatus Udaeobacter sp.]